MGFLTEALNSTANATKKTTKYEQLGYLENPFPPRGQVRPEIYVDRPELEKLQHDLSNFLTKNGPGAFWAMESERGIGKSNFLQHLDWELKNAVQNGQLEDTVHQYVPSPHIEPRLLVRYMLQAIGEERFSQLLREPPAVPDSYKGTELYRFFNSLKQRKPAKPKQPKLFENDDQKQPDTEDTHFLMRWLGGHQVYVNERDKYHLWADERLPPAVAFPYLRILVNGMESQGILKRIVLLLDEFEDIQTLKTQPQSEYIQALKGLLNSFNWRGLFIIMAGQSASFTTLGNRYPSLSDRWQRVKLEPVQSSVQAVILAKAYMEFGRQEYLKQHHSTSKKSLPFSPSEVEIKAIYADVKKPVMTQQEVTQRDLLDKLHEWIEKQG